MKRLVVYYSLSGNTRAAARTVACALHADLYEIRTVRPMPSSRAAQMLLGGMQSSLGLYPKLQDAPCDPAAYDEIIVGAPVWAGKCAAPMMRFLRQYDVNGRVTAGFTLSGGGDNDGCVRQWRRYLPNLQVTVALADRHNPVSSDNARQLQTLVERLTAD